MDSTQQSSLRWKTLEAIHDNAVDAIITITERGIIETVNPSTQTLFGYDSSELIGKNVKLLMPNPYSEEHDSYLSSYMETRKPRIIGVGREVVARKKDGTIFPIHLAVSEIELDGRRVFAGFVRDLTAFKEVEQQQSTLGRIIEDSLNEVFIFDARSFRFIQVNRGARLNLGYSLKELQELTPVDIKPEFTRSEFEERIAKPLLTEESENLIFSTIHQRKDGSTYDVEVHLQLATYHTKPVFVAIILDISERLKAQRLLQEKQQEMQTELERLVETRTRELRETQEELVRAEKFSTLGKVSGGIAHEIRNPLNAVKTSAYFLLHASNPGKEKIAEHLERIDRQVSLIDSVITSLSDVAKLPEANLGPVAMEPVIRSVISGINLPDNIKVEFELPDDIPAVLADESQIVIAYRNLVRNARDAMADGGVLTLRAIVEEETVSFQVIDDGIGIAEQLLDNILEPLFTTKARGMGLGLSITLAIVEKNQGSLNVDSRIGKGSTFSVKLRRSDI